MSALAPTMQAFFTDRLVRQRRASGHTVATYRDTAAAARVRRNPEHDLEEAHQLTLALGGRQLQAAKRPEDNSDGN